MRKALIVAVLAAFMAGCALNAKVCQNQEKFWEYKGRIAASLAMVQATYPAVLAIVDEIKPNALDEEQAIQDVDFYLAKVQVIDTMLDYLGQMYFDNFCPTEEDVVKAEAAANVALAQAHELKQAAEPAE